MEPFFIVMKPEKYSFLSVFMVFYLIKGCIFAPETARDRAVGSSSGS